MHAIHLGDSLRITKEGSPPQLSFMMLKCFFNSNVCCIYGVEQPAERSIRQIYPILIILLSRSHFTPVINKNAV